MVAKMCKMQKVFNFAHFIPKNTHISLYKNMQIYTTALQMNSNRAYIYIYIYTVTVHVKMILFFKFFFSLLYQTTSLPLRLQQPVASPMSTTTQDGRIRRKQKITTQPPNPAPPPNTTS